MKKGYTSRQEAELLAKAFVDKAISAAFADFQSKMKLLHKEKPSEENFKREIISIMRRDEKKELSDIQSIIEQRWPGKGRQEEVIVRDSLERMYQSEDNSFENRIREWYTKFSLKPAQAT
ncbi:MAG: hypothetical protein ACE14S_08730 [Candidatus Bathyarchaeia archaeon]